ncbi:Glucose-6-phosphate exchanger SLC37A4 [Chionoecetes opilio]|uniref:Glucose-6-phosphate exchanger SLC37A4 n=1 Tax=Chionoecetes opilio TaxID=41210 RepID=A0A8J4Y4K7_CHIOP|nr:Glucose-6-phosphate exchanger SLC37A4 [Chionoecetes opilio]
MGTLDNLARGMSKQSKHSKRRKRDRGSSSVTLLNMAQERETVTQRITNRPSYPNGNANTLKISSNSSNSSNGGGKTKLQQLQSYQRSVFAALFLGYACYTYNRKSVSYATPTLLATGLITTNTVGVISSCQNMAYAVSKFLGGVLSDKMSARILFSVGLAMSGVSTLLFSRTEDPVLWSMLWALNGFAQGCGWPSCAKLLKKWFSPDNFGTWWSVLTASSNLSGTLSPLLAAYVIITHGWSASLVIAGLASILMSGVTLVTLVDDPEQAGLPSPARPAREPVKTVEQKEETKENNNNNNNQQGGGMKDLLASPFLWLVSACYLCIFMAKTAISEWGQLYLITELGRSQMEVYVAEAGPLRPQDVSRGAEQPFHGSRAGERASSFTSAVETGGFFGGILAGVLTDRIASKVKVRANVRLLVAAAFMCVCCGGLYVLAAVLTKNSSQSVLSSWQRARRPRSVFSPTGLLRLLGTLVSHLHVKAKAELHVIYLTVLPFPLLAHAPLGHFQRLPKGASPPGGGVLCGAVLGASMFGPISIYGIVASESFPAHLSGTAHAFVALAANVGAVLAGWPLSRVARAWSWAGVLTLLQFLCGGAAVLIVTTPRLHVTPKAKHH